MENIDTKLQLGKHLNKLRADRKITLETLSSETGISRATLSRIENGEVSPTAESLGKLAASLAVPISYLLSPLEQGFRPLITRDNQSIWRDPKSQFERRSISPPSGQLAVELIEAYLGPNQTITYDGPSIPGQEHHLYIISGRLVLNVEGNRYELNSGDCLRYKLFGTTVFQTHGDETRYIIALL